MSYPSFCLDTCSDIEQWRYETFWTKEPETLAWIKSFTWPETGANIFLDIGANIGLYSLYAAALYPSMMIFAYEPQPENFFRLCHNAEINRFNNIIPVRSGFGTSPDFMKFFYTDRKPGASTGGFNNKNFSAYSLTPVMSIDVFGQIYGLPRYIKIDVDGYESQVITGARRTLRNQNLKSLLVEFETNDNITLAGNIKRITDAGFVIDARLNSLPNHSRTRREAEGIMVKNIIFSRPELLDLNEHTRFAE